MRQQSFELKTWGGKRDGAGRRSARERPVVPHLEREPFRASQPVHVPLRVSDHVWNLRSERSFRIIDAAFRGIRCRPDFRVVHFSVQGNQPDCRGERHGGTDEWHARSRYGSPAV